ncbi:MAG: hypothetical protein M5U28_08470 [Sandaracinaceae bacterium]|nr:hypothetical protein [Sandaracinaceae bacterium]
MEPGLGVERAHRRRDQGARPAQDAPQHVRGRVAGVSARVLPGGLRDADLPDGAHAAGHVVPDGFLCRARHINRVLWDRRELYGAEYRRWHWRLAYEQLLFSHVTPIDGVAPWQRIRGPVLLLAGARDNFRWTHIYERTRDLAWRLATRGVHGACLLLRNTGHSIHDERPRLLAGAIDRFIERYS